MNTKDELIGILSGTVKGLHRAKVALGMWEEIAKSAEEIKKTQYNELFGYVQSHASKVLALRVCDLFTPYKQARPEYCFRYLLDFLRNNSKEIEPEQPEAIYEILRSQKAMAPPKLNRCFAEHLRSELPTGKEGDDREISIAFEDVRTFRDKWAAHYEITDEKQEAGLDNIQALFSLAERLIHNIGIAYNLPPALDIGDKYVLDNAAQAPANSLAIMLEQLEIAKPE